MCRSALLGLLISLLSSAFGLSYDEWKETHDQRRYHDNVDFERFPVQRTRGQPIPWPQSVKTSSEGILTIIPTQFEIIPTGAKCEILRAAVRRYYHIILLGENYDDGGGSGGGSSGGGDESGGGGRSGGGQGGGGSEFLIDYAKRAACEEEIRLLHTLYIDVANPCDGRLYPSADMNENYSLQVTSVGAVLKGYFYIHLDCVSNTFYKKL